MANRTVVSIEPGFNDMWMMRLSKAPVEIQNGRIPKNFTCDPENMLIWNSEAAVRQHGQKLLDELEKHPGIKEAIQDILNVAPGNSHSFYLHLMVEAAERLCWETLCNRAGEFFSLDTRWPIARIADSIVDRPVPFFSFSPPLKVMALMSASGRSATKEWINLKNAVLVSRADGLEVDLFVLVGEQSLFESIKNDIDNGLENVRVAPVPDRTSELENLIANDFRPQILHFFCHGSASHGVPRLELATLLDEMEGRLCGSLKINCNDLLGGLALKGIWFVTLNCCEGGRAEENMHSMAHQLVAHGVPAAVGVLEAFDASDAHEFCGAFYPAIFKKLKKVREEAPDDGLIELEWADALRLPRKNLNEKHGNDPCNHREWALPVLYVRPEPFYLSVKPLGLDPDALSAMKQKTEEIAGALAALPPDAPVVFREALLDLLQDTPENMKPDLQGNYSNA